MKPLETHTASEWKTVAWIAGILVAIALCFIAPAAVAQSPGPSDYSFTMSPLLVELQSVPGGREQFDVFVVNESRTKEATFEVSVLSVRERRDGSYELLDGQTGEYSAASWITVEPETFTLGPGDSTIIQGHVQVPRNEQGGRYAAVVFRLMSDEERDPEARASVVVEYRLATIVELTIGSRFTKRAYVSSLDVVPASELGLFASRFGEDALLIRASLTNESNVHVFGRGRVMIRNADGRKVRDIPLGQGRGAVIPGATVDFGSVLPSGLPPGEYTVQAVIDYGGIRPAIARREVTIEGDRLRADQFDPNRPVRFLVEPLSLEYELPQGAVRIDTVRVENHDDSPIQVRARVYPLRFDEQGDVVVPEADGGEPAGFPWLRLRPAEVALRPGESRNIRLMVSQPREAEGARYGHIVFEGVRSEGDQEADASSVGTRISVLPHERPQPTAALSAVRVLPGTQEGAFAVGVQVENAGKIHFDARGTVTVMRKVIPESTEEATYEGEGYFEQVWRGALSAAPLEMVLPGETRRVLRPIDQPLGPGHYRILVEVDYGAEAPIISEKEFVVANPGAGSNQDHTSERTGERE